MYELMIAVAFEKNLGGVDMLMEEAREAGIEVNLEKVRTYRAILCRRFGKRVGEYRPYSNPRTVYNSINKPIDLSKLRFA